ncbi:P68 family surface lipoprotein [Mycoplasmopsis bovis]|uniref:P68 family surface lipoprotein n=1 Tax=Mycoplasmopsis bovis TaxID=28903 RepID=UPI003D2D3225
MNKKKLLFGIIPLAVAAPMIAASCQKNDKKVVFQFAQSNSWPLPKMLVPLVKYYNTTFSKHKDFLPIELQFSDKTKTTREFELIKKVKNDIETNNEAALPNLILGAQSGAYVLNQHKRLMDLSDYGITKSIFNKNIADLHSKLPGQKGNDKIYSIPFDNLDVDAVVYNLEVLDYMFKMIKKNGGNVDENATIVQKATEAGREGVGSKLPENTI